jgi:hypothetical protein
MSFAIFYVLVLPALIPGLLSRPDCSAHPSKPGGEGRVGAEKIGLANSGKRNVLCARKPETAGE